MAKRNLSNLRKNGIQTIAFGTPGYISHDFYRFYNSKLYQGLSIVKDVEYVENQIDPQNINKIFCKSSQPMSELPDNNVH